MERNFNMKIELTEEQVQLFELVGSKVMFADGKEYYNLPHWFEINKEDNTAIEYFNEVELPEQLTSFYLETAIKTLQKELAKDKSEGSYYYGWQANIAMAFYDEFVKTVMKENLINNVVSLTLLYKIANQAAKNFLDLLINQK